MGRVNIGIIGAGMMGQEHIQNFNLLEDARVVALADTSAEMLARAQAMADGDARISDDFESLLVDPNIDALVIATPNFHHIDVLAAAIETGKPILCEKPLCTTLADTQQVVRQVAERGTIFQVGMEYRFKPALADMIARVDRGDIGVLQMLSIREHRFPFLPKVSDWNRFNANTGGTLVEKCCHFFDLMRRIIGSEPVSVLASAGQNVNHLDERYDGLTPDIWDNGYVVFDFSNGARAMLDLCMFAEGSRHSEELSAVGNKAKVECLLPQNIVTHGHRDSWVVDQHDIHVPEEILNAGYHSGATYFQNRAFLDAVKGEAGVIVNADDGHRAVAMGIAAQMAASERRRVDMKELGL